MKRVLAIILVCLLTIGSLGISTSLDVGTYGQNGNINNETRSPDLPEPTAISATLTVDIYKIYKLDSVDVGTQADWYFWIRTVAEGDVQTKTSTIPIAVDTDNIDPVPASEAFHPSITLSNPLSVIQVTVALWEDDGAGTASDDVADISPIVGGGADDYGATGPYPFGPSGSLLYFNYYILREGALSDHRWQDELGNWNAASSYFWYSGEQSPDSSTGVDENDAQIYLSIWDDYSDSSGPSAPTISSSTHTENIWSTNDDPSFTWTTPSDPSGIYGYSYAWDTSGSTTPDTTVDTTGNSASYSSVADGGSYYFHVRALDNAGNWGSTDHFGPVKIDDTAPSAPTISSSTHTENVWSNNNEPSFSWNEPSDTSGIAEYRYAFDHSPSTTPTTSWGVATITFAGIADGSDWYMHVRAQDGAGNLGGTDHYGSVKIDTTIGTPTSVDDGVSGWSNDNTPAFTWSAPSDLSGISGYYWKVDSGSDTWITSASVTLPTQPDGSHTFYVKAKDNANNVGSYGSHAFQIDATPPGTPTISSSTHPSETTWYSNNDPAFTWTSVGGPSSVTYYYGLDNPTPSSPTTGTTRSETDVSDGIHTFYVKATDTGGSSSADSYIIKIDATKPTSSVNAITPYWYALTTINSTATDPVSDVASVELFYNHSKDNSTWFGWNSSGSDTSSPWSWAFGYPGGDGYYQFYSRATDSAGNPESVSGADASCGRDTTAPSSSVGALAATQTSASFLVSWSGSDATSGLKWFDVQYKDGASGSWTNWMTQATNASATFNGVDGHTYYFQSRAQDAAGNLENYPGSADAYTTVDVPSVTGWIEGFAYKSGTSIAIPSVTVSIEGGSSTTTDASGHYNLTVAPGNYHVTASKTGFNSDAKDVNVTAGHATTQNFYLTEISNAGWLEGHVYVSGSAALIPDAVIAVNSVNAATTDASGHYNISLSSGAYTITASKSGYSTGSASVTIVEGHATTRDFNLDPISNPGWAAGHVYLSGTTTPIAGATVSVTSGPSTTTSSNGDFNVTLSSGSHSVSATKPGYSTDTKTLTISGGQETTADFYLTPVASNGTIEGCVYISGTTTPINGAAVQIQGGASATTDSTGHYSFTVPAGTYSLTASKTGYASDTKSVTVTAGQATARDFYLTPSGPDTDSDGLPDDWEQEHFGNLAQAANGDPDNDGLTNLQEYAMDTEPDNADTDGDGIKDGADPNPLVPETTQGSEDILKNPWFWILLIIVISVILAVLLYARRKKPEGDVPKEQTSGD